MDLYPLIRRLLSISPKVVDSIRSWSEHGVAGASSKKSKKVKPKSIVPQQSINRKPFVTLKGSTVASYESECNAIEDLIEQYGLDHSTHIAQYLRTPIDTWYAGVTLDLKKLSTHTRNERDHLEHYERKVEFLQTRSTKLQELAPELKSSKRLLIEKIDDRLRRNQVKLSHAEQSFCDAMDTMKEAKERLNRIAVDMWPFMQTLLQLEQTHTKEAIVTVQNRLLATLRSLSEEGSPSFELVPYNPYNASARQLTYDLEPATLKNKSNDLDETLEESDPPTPIRQNPSSSNGSKEALDKFRAAPIDRPVVDPVLLMDAQPDEKFHKIDSGYIENDDAHGGDDCVDISRSLPNTSSKDIVNEMDWSLKYSAKREILEDSEVRTNPIDDEVARIDLTKEEPTVDMSVDDEAARNGITKEESMVDISVDDEVALIGLIKEEPNVNVAYRRSPVALEKVVNVNANAGKTDALVNGVDIQSDGEATLLDHQNAGKVKPFKTVELSANEGEVIDLPYSCGLVANTGETLAKAAVQHDFVTNASDTNEFDNTEVNDDITFIGESSFLPIAMPEEVVEKDLNLIQDSDETTNPVDEIDESGFAKTDTRSNAQSKEHQYFVNVEKARTSIDGVTIQSSAETITLEGQHTEHLPPQVMPLLSTGNGLPNLNGAVEQPNKYWTKARPHGDQISTERDDGDHADVVDDNVVTTGEIHSIPIALSGLTQQEHTADMGDEGKILGLEKDVYGNNAETSSKGVEIQRSVESIPFDIQNVEQNACEKHTHDFEPMLVPIVEKGGNTVAFSTPDQAIIENPNSSGLSDDNPSDYLLIAGLANEFIDGAPESDEGVNADVDNCVSISQGSSFLPRPVLKDIADLKSDDNEEGDDNTSTVAVEYVPPASAKEMLLVASTDSEDTVELRNVVHDNKADTLINRVKSPNIGESTAFDVQNVQLASDQLPAEVEPIQPIGNSDDISFVSLAASHNKVNSRMDLCVDDEHGNETARLFNDEIVPCPIMEDLTIDRADIGTNVKIGIQSGGEASLLDRKYVEQLASDELTAEFDVVPSAENGNNADGLSINNEAIVDLSKPRVFADKPNDPLLIAELAEHFVHSATDRDEDVNTEVDKFVDLNRDNSFLPISEPSDVPCEPMNSSLDPELMNDGNETTKSVAEEIVPSSLMKEVNRNIFESEKDEKSTRTSTSINITDYPSSGQVQNSAGVVPLLSLYGDEAAVSRNYESIISYQQNSNEGLLNARLVEDFISAATTASDKHNTTDKDKRGVESESVGILLHSSLQSTAVPNGVVNEKMDLGLKESDEMTNPNESGSTEEESTADISGNNSSAEWVNHEAIVGDNKVDSRIKPILPGVLSAEYHARQELPDSKNKVTSLPSDEHRFVEI